ncbi:MAG TPA: hypothetical protein VIG62_07955 [Blastocatellia bacterium]
MKLDECEETVLSKMAEMEGEPPLISEEQTARHLIGCEKCRMEIKRQQAAANLFRGQKRRADEVSLWSEIEKRISDKPIVRRDFFLLLGAILVIYKLLEMIPSQDLGFLFKFVPIILIAALFFFFKENPFKINTELKVEGELQ